MQNKVVSDTKYIVDLCSLGTAFNFMFDQLQRSHYEPCFLLG